MARALHGTSVEAIHQLVAARRLHDRPDMQMHDTTTTTASYVIPVHYVLNKLQNAQFKDTETLHDKFNFYLYIKDMTVLRLHILC